jgi:hypothetical protein
MVDKLIMGMLGRDYGGITITAGPIRSRNHTPTKHLGSSLLDHIISRHMRRERIRPSTPPRAHVDYTSQAGMGIKVSWLSRVRNSSEARDTTLSLKFRE